jgi:uncharacterized membrane protein
MASTLVTSRDRTLNVEIVQVPIYAPFTWLRDGWFDMRRHWGASLGYGALILALGWTLLIFCGTHPYFIAAAISGFLLVGPLMSAGLCEMSRRYSLGQPASFDDSLEGFAQHVPALMEIGVILSICAAGWFLLSALLLGSVFHIGAPDIRATMYHGFLDSTNRQQVLAYIAVGGVLATCVFTSTVIAIPLIVDRNASAAQAMRASVAATLGNKSAMILWSALILSLTIIGYAPLLAGMLIIAPLLGHATWHAYLGMTGQPRSVSRPKDVAAKATTQVSMSELDELVNPNDRREAYLQKVRPKP